MGLFGVGVAEVKLTRKASHNLVTNTAPYSMPLVEPHGHFALGCRCNRPLGLDQSLAFIIVRDNH